MFALLVWSFLYGFMIVVNTSVCYELQVNALVAVFFPTEKEMCINCTNLKTKVLMYFLFTKIAFYSNVVTVLTDLV